MYVLEKINYIYIYIFNNYFRLIEHLLDGVMNPTSKRIVKEFLSKEVSNGNVIRLSNGNFSLTSPKQPDRNMINSVTSTSTPQRNGDSLSKIKNSASLSLLKGGYTIHYNGDSTEDNGNSLKSSRQGSPKDLESLIKKKFRFESNGGQIAEKNSNARKDIEEIPSILGMISIQNKFINSGIRFFIFIF